MMLKLYWQSIDWLLRKMILYFMNNNIKYIGLFIVIILFGIFSLPKIYERVVNSDTKDSNTYTLPNISSFEINIES